MLRPEVSVAYQWASLSRSFRAIAPEPVFGSAVLALSGQRHRPGAGLPQLSVLRRGRSDLHRVVLRLPAIVAANRRPELR
jgi:hypothetical protein